MKEVVFSTKRLHVRLLRPTDLSLYYEMVSNPKVMQHVKEPLSFVESKAELSKFISYYTASKFYNIWAVTTKEEDDLIGICGVYQNQSKEYEIAYRLLEKCWSKGYGHEIAHQLIRHCIDTLKLPEIVAYSYSANTGSVKILEKEMQFVIEEPSLDSRILGRKYALKR